MKKIIFPIIFIAIVAISASYIYIEKMEGKKNIIRIGLNDWPGYELFYLAKQKEFYKKEGVNVEIVQYSSLDDVRYGFEAGQIDIMCSTIIELILTHSKTKHSPQAFFITDFSNGGDVILSQNKIKEGFRIAVEPQSLGLYMLTRYLDKNNLTFEDVQIRTMSQQEMFYEMKEKNVDAAITYPPVSVNIKREIPNVQKVFSSKDIPGEIIDIASASPEFIKTRKEDLKKIVKAWDKAVVYLQKNKKEASKIMAKREGITTEEFIETLNDLKILSSKDQKKYMKVGGKIYQSIEKAIGIFFDRNLIEKEINSDKLISLEIANEIK